MIRLRLRPNEYDTTYICLQLGYWSFRDSISDTVRSANIRALVWFRLHGRISPTTRAATTNLAQTIRSGEWRR